MILHVDMDAFYASVEIMDNPELADKPVIVGGKNRRGVVAAASYAVRKYGVHSAMPMFMALQKCPHAVVIQPSRQRYDEVSHNIMRALGKLSPRLVKLSIDEAFIDMNATKYLYANTLEMISAVKDVVYSQYPLTCSVGAAPIKFLAKIASDINKPNGHFIIEENEIMPFIDKLPIEKVPGVGKQSGVSLKLLGINYLGDMRRLPEQVVVSRLGKHGLHLVELAYGRDDRELTPPQARKSMGSEHTLDDNTSNLEILQAYLLAQASEVGFGIRMRGLYFSVVTLKIKYADFTTQTRQKALAHSMSSSKAIYDTAVELLASKPLKMPLRLIGVAVSGFGHEKPAQLDLFNVEHSTLENWDKVDDAMDAIQSRFGKNAVTNAAVLNLKKSTMFNDEEI